MFSSWYNDDQALAGMQVLGKCKRKMLWAERFKDRIRRFVKTRLRASVPPTGGLDAEGGIRAHVPLPGAGEFQAALADAFAAAVESGSNLAVLYLDVPECPPELQEEIGLSLRHVSRNPGDVFLYSPGCFALLLCKTGPDEAAMFSLEVLNLLRMNFPENRIRINLAAYPQNVQSLEGLEALAPGIVPTLQHAELSEW
jgi:hypothetical protein